MGCLNSNGQFAHWFGNIHLSGPCNRACYFCIGQHMMSLDPLNVLDTWPLPNIDQFVEVCQKKGIREINLTGSNTDPLLYRHIPELRGYLEAVIPDLIFGVRTNGALALRRIKEKVWQLFDKASISITSFDPEIYWRTMGRGTPPDVEAIMKAHPIPIKLNIVLCPDNVETLDVLRTLDRAAELGIKKVNLREPYGQPHVGNPLADRLAPISRRYGMPVYDWNGVEVMYWDVHWVEV